MRIEKTVFISYRRTNTFHARAVHQALCGRGYDVFLDVESISSGAFEQVILTADRRPRAFCRDPDPQRPRTLHRSE